MIDFLSTFLLYLRCTLDPYQIGIGKEDVFLCYQLLLHEFIIICQMLLPYS